MSVLMADPDLGTSLFSIQPLADGVTGLETAAAADVFKVVPVALVGRVHSPQGRLAASWRLDVMHKDLTADRPAEDQLGDRGPALHRGRPRRQPPPRRRTRRRPGSSTPGHDHGCARPRRIRRCAYWTRDVLTGTVSGALRLADLLGGLSMVADYGFGLPPGTAVRTGLVAAALGRRMGLADGEVRDGLYTGLLMHVGCVGISHESAAAFGDDIRFYRAVTAYRCGRPGRCGHGP